MDYRLGLALAHSILKPELYVEIGCARGASLTLARCPSVAIDPAFEIVFPLAAPTRVFRETSDDFFERADLSRIFGREIDLGFIDGMHRVENVLKDFTNLERFAARRSAILVDDVLPSDMAWATRSVRPGNWTGDVYRAVLFLRKYRPDLAIDVFDVDVRGLAVITNLDRTDQSIFSNWQKIESEIAAGAQCLTTIADMRAALMPRSPGELEGHLRAIVAG